MPATAPWQSWLRRLSTGPGARLRLVCFPPAAGAASFFRSWRPPDTIELWAIQPPGREDRIDEPEADGMRGTVAGVVQALQWINNRPMAFFGHSLGALVAYETALRLERMGMPGPVHLFASSCRAPSRIEARSLADWEDTTAIAELRRWGVPPNLLDDANSRTLVISAAQHDLSLFFSYQHRPGESVSCPVTVMVGDQDPATPLVDAAKWERHTAGVTELRVYAGGHHYVNDHCPQVIAALGESLAPFLTPPTTSTSRHSAQRSGPGDDT